MQPDQPQDGTGTSGSSSGANGWRSASMVSDRSGSSRVSRQARKAQLAGGLVGLALGLGLLGWAVAADVVSLGDGGSVAEQIDCSGAEGIERTDCGFFKGIAALGESFEESLESLVLLGIFVSTVILVALGIGLGGLIQRRREGRMVRPRASGRAQPQGS
jgi:hypothetical protein